MTKIVCKHTGKVLYPVGTDFVIEPNVSFSLIAVLTEGLPSSEEGRMAYNITETFVATVEAKFSAMEFMGQDHHSEILHRAFVDSIGDPTTTTIDQSRVYQLMNDKQKQIVHQRLRNLLTAVAEKEAIEANAALVPGVTGVEEVNKKIADLIFAINRLLGKVSAKPLVGSEIPEPVKGAEEPVVEPSQLQWAVGEFISKYTDGSISADALMKKLVKEYNDGFSVVG